jgi:hypothetical protein
MAFLSPGAAAPFFIGAASPALRKQALRRHGTLS